MQDGLCGAAIARGLHPTMHLGEVCPVCPSQQLERVTRVEHRGLNGTHRPEDQESRLMISSRLRHSLEYVA